MFAHVPRSFPQPGHRYDVAVVGAGLAGCEVASRLARAGRDVLLVTQSLDSVANLFHARVPGPFPPSSLMEEARRAVSPDETPWALHREVKGRLEAQSGVHLLQSCVSSLEPAVGDAPHRLLTWEGPSLSADAVVLAVGSFLRGRLRAGTVEEEAGRLTEVAYDFLADDLAARGVTFEEREDVWAGESGAGGALPYAVRYLTLAPSELDGFALRRWPHVFAVGRCTPGDVTYASAVEAGSRLAGVLA
ncbi:FAD-dependent oxidoreductase [Deinococcus pimensis]|uniref:FAD-dependent oxidoreductase n=1 Tax=Deinococcus pimensis TaxID=309888 RepID=UPI000484B152|nr:FAD-dependent oxidoreductase [Deinococcus pimensis]